MKRIVLGLTVLAVATLAQAKDSIQLPSGGGVKIASFAAHPKWKESFPQDNPFFVEKYADGNLQGMHSRYSGRLDGASATLCENGNLKMLAYYPGGQLQGACRVWDDEQRMLLYCNYKDSKKHGITCLLKDGVPWLLQEWNKGALESETVVVRRGTDFVAVDDPQQLAKAKERLSTVEKELAETVSGTKTSLRKWFADEGDRIKKEKGKILTQVAKAQHNANEQVIKKEYAERARANADAVARSHQAAINAGSRHPVRDARIAGAARAARAADARESRAADGDIKAANKNAKAVTGEAKHELSQMDKDITEHYKHLYRFAMAALEKSLPTESASGGKAKPPEVQKTFVITYRTHKGKVATDEVVAPTVEKAKKKWRGHHPQAVLKSIEVK